MLGFAVSTLILVFLDVTAVRINKVRVAAGVPERDVSVSPDGDLSGPRAGPGRRGCAQADVRSRKGATPPIGVKIRNGPTVLLLYREIGRGIP